MNRREQILHATALLIAQDGVAALTTKRIAAQAGCAEGTIFRHFGDKGGLIAAVLSFGLPEIAELSHLTAAAPQGDLRSGLLQLSSAVMAYYQASSPIAAAALSDRAMFERYSAAHRAGHTGPKQIWNLARDFLEAHRAAGHIGDGADLEIQAISLVGACQNAVWVRLVNGADSLPHGEQFLEKLVDAHMAALAA
ncbi:MAG: TetR/AcrR family transcriptional regulator [Actinomycetota bacterium]|nr:TetR/AcrR family transcriptional regulator [Actinomycetota bacterium]